MCDLSSCTVMIVDDTETNIDILVEALGSDFDLRVAMDGETALEAIADETPDLILLDIMMPDIKGNEVCRKIKSNEDTRDVKIIVLSAYLDEEKFKEMKDHGADVCFSKPLPLPQLKEEVARLLELK